MNRTYLIYVMAAIVWAWLFVLLFVVNGCSTASPC